MGSSGEAKELIEEYKLGVSVKPSSVDDFKNAFIKLSDKSYIHNPNLGLFCNKFSLNTVSNNYIKVFSNLKVQLKNDKQTNITNNRWYRIFWQCCFKEVFK